MRRKAYIYVRFSSDNQRVESNDAQERHCRDFADRNELEVAGVYRDQAKSATSDRRPEFQRMIADTERGLVDVVLVHKLDRFARDRYDSARYRHKLKKNGVELISVLEPMDDSPESIILQSLLEGMAEYYSKNLAREVMKGMGETARKCQHTGGIPPLGYDVDPKTKKYVINETEAATVRAIFELYLMGYGYNQIVTELNDRGLKTKVGGPFGKNSLHDILVNQKYNGTYTYNRSAAKNADGQRNTHHSKEDDKVIRVPGGVPAIVDEETFQKVQEKMANNRRGPGAYKAKEVFLLSGLIVCGECLKRGLHHSMMGNTKYSGQGKNKLVTYRCGNRDRAKDCDNKDVRREYVENFVLAQLEKNILSEKAIPKLLERLNKYQAERDTRSSAEIEVLRLEADKADREIANIVEAVAAGFSKSVMAAKLNELERKKDELEARIAALGSSDGQKKISEDELRGLFGMLREYIKERNVPEIRRFIGSYIEKVIVYKDHVEVVFRFCVGKDGAGQLRFAAQLSRDRLNEGKVA